jgi:uncharacterized protein
LPHRLEFDETRIEEFCRRWRVAELEVFGSVLRDDFGPTSDIDVLVTFNDDAQPTLLTLTTMQGELEVVFSRKVDLVERRAIERSDNYIRRASILGSREPVYVAR